MKYIIVAGGLKARKNNIFLQMLHLICKWELNMVVCIAGHYHEKLLHYCNTLLLIRKSGYWRFTTYFYTCWYLCYVCDQTSNNDNFFFFLSEKTLFPPYCACMAQTCIVVWKLFFFYSNITILESKIIKLCPTKLLCQVRNCDPIVKSANRGAS